MSNSAVLARPIESTDDGQGWIELDPPTEFASQEAMRSGPRSYTPEQGEVIDMAVRSRRPLPAPPLPIED